MSSLWWTDPAALASALGRLGVSAPASETPARLDALPGLSLLPGAGAVSGVSPIPRVSPGWTRAAGEPPAIVPTPPVPSLEPFAPPTGELGERLDAYLEWLAAAVGGRRPFVADRDGLPLAGEASEHDLMAIGSAVTRLLQRINDRSSQRLGSGVLLDVAGERLQLLLVDSELGLFTVGVLVAEPLAPAVLRRLEEGLRTALAAQT
jgi:predicted regulator of Ras-like GTPase activity (Roadblock/LC7/MglB family)